MHASAFNANRNPALPFIPCLTSTTRSTQDPGRHHAASPTSICTRPPAGSPERDLDCPKLGHPLEVLLDVCLANRLGDLADGVLEVVHRHWLADRLAVEVLELVQREPRRDPPHAHHRRVPADVGDVGAGVAGSLLGEGLHVDVVDLDALEVDLEERGPRGLVGQRDVDPLLQPPPHRLVQLPWVVGGGEDHDDGGLGGLAGAAVGAAGHAVHAVHLDQELALDAAGGLVLVGAAARRAERVDLVHEDRRRRVVPRHLEQQPH
mmetsp:Transcript_1845/g.4118  ORF Transcript_1845/g.4118 Transcript_1845/m.4118 type:complete len:263 (-) Transcript_1845:423-1211(-)